MKCENTLGKVLSIVMLFVSNSLATEPDPIQITRMLDVPIEQAWSSWTTVQGMQQFLAREAIVDARIDGAWRIVLDRLEHSYAHGPLDWDHLPENLTYSVNPDDL